MPARKFAAEPKIIPLFETNGHPFVPIQQPLEHRASDVQEVACGTGEASAKRP
jgi:hypothetical protein